MTRRGFAGPGQVSAEHMAAHRSRVFGGPVALTDTGAIYFAAGVDLQRDVAEPLRNPLGRPVLPLARRTPDGVVTTDLGLPDPPEPYAYAQAYGARLVDLRTPLLVDPAHDDVERGLAYANALAREHLPRAVAHYDATGRLPDVEVRPPPEVFDLIALAYTRKGATPPTEIAWPYGVRLVRRTA